MLPTKTELMNKAAHYTDLAEKAYKNYQMTGLSRYSRDQRNYEDLADVYRTAAASSDDHNAMLSLRSEVLQFAGRFDKAIVDEDCMSLLNTANELISYAVITCSYKRIEVPKE